MNEVIDILKLVLKHHSDYTDTYSVDDVDMVLEFKFVLKAFAEFCTINEVSENEHKIDSLYNVLFIASNRDSLIHIIELLNRGKLPYDSIWRKSESGHWYLTTVKNHFENEHHD